MSNALLDSPSKLSLDDIQGNVLRSYRLPVATHLFFHVEDAESARRWLREAACRVSAATWDRKHPRSNLAFNISFTHSGLRELGVRKDLLQSFPDAFCQGMAARSADLGDLGPSEPEQWIDAFRGSRVHLLASVYARDDAVLDEVVDETTKGATSQGLALVHGRRAEEMPGCREHFGFDDGFAQPAVAGAPSSPGEQGVSDGKGGWKELPPGEFVLGYPDAEGFLPPAPPDPLGDNGTYLVYRELAQDVGAFRRFTASVAQSFGREPAWVASRIVGRWQDGTPLSLSPDAPDPAISGDPARINDFSYHDDPRGFACPLGAHVRRANPRDTLAFGGAMVRRHRIIRRGMPYGPPLADAEEDDCSQERGLVFMCFNVDIVRQFEFVQRRWCHDGNVFGLGDDPDPLIGGGTGSNKMTVQGSPPRFISGLARFVTTRGGEYFFMPGLRAINALAAGELC